MTQAQTLLKDDGVETSKKERWRPNIHFTPEKNWINDPNGLVYFEGEYHLFYQYNPHGKAWGHMSWGHAVSSDLIHWEHLPIAIPEREFMVFSGCALVDWENTSGLGDGLNPPLLAYFTAFHEGALKQNQCIAYSHDRGRTWSMYDGNPIIDLDIEHFRDPSVFWHDESKAWIMAVALPREHKVQIYRSTNLIDWTPASAFGPAGATSGQWECPALMEVPDEHGTGRTKWVLKVDVDVDFVAGGSGAQYFVGAFDGFIFQPDLEDGQPVGRTADFGADFYAAIPWSDLPSQHTHPVWIAWMSNHQTGRFYPTDPWCGAMTLPRELFVFEEQGSWLLGQRPVSMKHIEQPAFVMGCTDLRQGHGAALMKLADGQAAILDFEIPARASGRLELILSDTVSDVLLISWDCSTREMSLTDVSGQDHLPDVQQEKTSSALPAEESTFLDVRMIIDASSIEIFLGGGRRVVTQCMFPRGDTTLTASAVDGDVSLDNVRFTRLNTAA